MKLTEEQFIANRQQRWREEIAEAENELRQRRERSEQSRKQRIADAIKRANAAKGGISDESANKIVDILESAMGDPPEISRTAERGLDRLIATDRNGGKAPYDWNEGERPATADERVEMVIYARFLTSQEPSGSKQAKYYQQLASKLPSGKGATVPDVREEHPRGPDMPDIYDLRGRPAELWRERLEKARG
jgi:hypothetical protein